MIDDGQAAVVREIARRLAAGEATGKICTDLNSRGIVGPGKTHHDHAPTMWAMTTVRLMMRNPRLAGWYAELTPDGSWSRVARSGKFPAILSDAEFDAVQVALDAVRRRRTTGVAVRHLLSGVVVCSVCSAQLRVVRVGESGVRYNHPSLTMARRRTRKDCEGPTSIDGVALEAHVRLAVSAFLERRSWERPEETPAALVEQKAAKERKLDELAVKVAREEMTLELAGRTERIILAEIVGGHAGENVHDDRRHGVGGFGGACELFGEPVSDRVCVVRVGGLVSGGHGGVPPVAGSGGCGSPGWLSGGFRAWRAAGRYPLRGAVYAGQRAVGSSGGCSAAATPPPEFGHLLVFDHGVVR
ncbi:recombinase family protein [Pseudofrankia sp. BMG5.37]|uniref:recombinase family protein n=1 Tax=Pseudofrankia sp. BMG5.37 TaxID=3050035 RepID=UPI002893EB28|nr:recombinase family protein [Pseudofrankia sp. BMG5.37]MDT3441091.1 recombinase family protein [Pseudofrankia sp. BMG5.37]